MNLERILKQLNLDEDTYLTKAEVETLRIYIHQLEQVIQRIKEII